MLHSLPPDLRSWTKILVKKYGLRAGQRMGQHFLVDKNVVRDIIKAAELNNTSKVLEVGGGLGVLTLALLESAGRVVVVELDNALVQVLQKLAVTGEKLKVLPGDILKTSDEELIKNLDIKNNQEFIIAANLPYEISGAFLRRFLGGDLLPQAMVVLLQLEVGERLVAPPGQTSLLTLSAQLACSNLELVRVIPPSAFWPEPRVTSCLMKLTIRTKMEKEALILPAEEKLLWRLARVGFASRRKVLINNLNSVLKLERSELEKIMGSLGLNLKMRAQELSLDQWISLTRTLKDLIKN
jgi:16S rRNA (adenine1518-N6/adenine1519-N6)-dimethyltransferase